MRFAEIVSAPFGTVPLTGLSFSSNFTAKPYAKGLPLPSTPVKSYFTPSPSAATTRVRLCGAGPGSNFDLAVFSFHVPTSGLLCANNGEDTTAANRAIATNFKTRFMGDPPWVSFRRSILEIYRENEALDNLRAQTIGRGVPHVKVPDGLLFGANRQAFRRRVCLT